MSYLSLGLRLNIHLNNFFRNRYPKQVLVGQYPLLKDFDIIYMRYVIVSFFSLLCLFAYGQDILISEVCPSNTDYYVDSYEESPDWFELYNPTDSPINLSDYAISTSNMVDVYTLPAIELAPQQYILFSQQVVNDVVKQWETIIDM